jgi:transcriptional regulator with XRE-family HTH domain
MSVMTISEKIFELIKERGMTQKEFSQATGIEHYWGQTPLNFHKQINTC